MVEISFNVFSLWVIFFIIAKCMEFVFCILCYYIWKPMEILASCCLVLENFSKDLRAAPNRLTSWFPPPLIAAASASFPHICLIDESSFSASRPVLLVS